MRSGTGLLFLLLWICLPQTSFAFDYLEHSFFTDLACNEARKESITKIVDEKSAARYIALSFFCPDQGMDDYCKQGYKSPQSLVNLVSSPRDFSITLGDLAALPDHVSRFGPLKNVQRAAADGIITSFSNWISSEGTVGGVIEDVAEDACEYETQILWSALNQEIVKDLSHFKKALPRIPEKHLSSLARSKPAKGPNDPSTKYTLDNPHYLDMVLRNHSHFGDNAFDAWLGFRQLSKDIRMRNCEEVVDFSASEVEDIAENLDLDNQDWSDFNPKQLARASCELLGIAMAKRMEHSFLLKEENQFVKSLISKVIKGDSKARDLVVLSSLAAVVQGVGIHFLQDGLAGGHLRTIRSRESLAQVRHDHDADNVAGVVAIFGSKDSDTPFIAFGDSYLLSGRLGKSDCKNMTTNRPVKPDDLTDCLLRFQRALITGATRDELLSFILPYDSQSPFTIARMTDIPSRAGDHGKSIYKYGSLPVPPPTFSFESLSFRFGLSTKAQSPQIGLKLEALSELDNPAHWMVSYQLGLNYQSSKQGGDSLFVDFAYAFHYRFFARVTLDFIPAVYGGVGGLGHKVAGYFGFAPTLGVTFLPEGWIDIPLEINILYRLPVELWDSEHTKNAGLKVGVLDDHWIQIGLGLAFMH